MSYYLVLGLTLLITLGSQAYINSCYKKTSRIESDKRITGYEVAKRIIKENDLDVKVEKIQGTLTDHYDPRTKTVRLSTDIYEGKSLASISVASHECGHAIQDKNGYLFLRIRRSLIPIVNIASYAGYIAIAGGALLGLLNLIWLGIIFEVVILAFQLITLPVEFNASSRALKQIKELKMVNDNEHANCRKMLTAAALTYVASAAAALLEVMRLVLMFRNRD